MGCLAVDKEQALSSIVGQGRRPVVTRGVTQTDASVTAAAWIEVI